MTNLNKRREEIQEEADELWFKIRSGKISTRDTKLRLDSLNEKIRHYQVLREREKAEEDLRNELEPRECLGAGVYGD